MGLDSLYCGKWRKISKSHCDLGLDGTKPNVELIRDIFIYYNIFKFQVPRLIIFGVIMLTDTHTHRHTHTHTHRKTHNDEYSIIAVDKPQL